VPPFLDESVDILRDIAKNEMYNSATNHNRSDLSQSKRKGREGAETRMNGRERAITGVVRVIGEQREPILMSEFGISYASVQSSMCFGYICYGYE